MENASDALIMAGSFLLFIFALTVTVSSLTNIRIQSQEILNARDQLLITTDDSGGYINYLQSGTNNSNAIREVGIETIITSIRRMSKESYIIYIEPKNNTEILNNEYKDLKVGNTNSIELSLSGTKAKYISKDNLTKLLYLIHEKLKDGKFEEYIGTYQYKADGVADVNKTTYKIITYKQTS